MEPIYHFRCAVCRMWWSIGDWEITKDMYCPHCGSKGRTIPVGKVLDSVVTSACYQQCLAATVLAVGWLS